MATQWDEDEHLLDKMLDDNVGIDEAADDGDDGDFQDGWDEELTGLISDDEAMPAPAVGAATKAAAEILTEGDKSTGVIASVSNEEKSSAAASQNEDENAWDFESDLAFDDESSVAPSAGVLPSNGPSIQAVASSALVEALRAPETATAFGSDSSAGKLSRKDPTNYDQTPQQRGEPPNGMDYPSESTSGSPMSAEKIETGEDVAIHHVPQSDNFFDAQSRNGKQKNGNDWDFEDDMFNDETRGSDIQSEEHTMGISPPQPPAFSHTHDGHKAVTKPPPPTSPQQNGTRVTADDVSDVNDQNEEHRINKQNDWDFEDDLFNDEPSPSDMNANQTHDKTQQTTNKLPPPPPPPPQHVPTPHQAQPIIQIHQKQKNPFLEDVNDNAHQSAPIVDGHGNFDGEGDGWSDDEAFFNDDAIENLPVVASKSLSKSHPPPPPSYPPPTQLQQQQPPFTDPTQIKIYQMLLTYLSNISHPHFLSRLHSKLHSKLDSASNLRVYYATRPGLKRYTLGVELDRMDYVVVVPGGRRLDDKDVIRSYFGVGPDGSDYTPQEEVAPSAEEVLIRSANQSLLADALVALTGSEDVLLENDEFYNHGDTCMALILSGPMLSMTSVAETCNFVVDLFNGMVEATCVLAIGVPFHGENGVHEGIVKDGRLVLARARVSVRFRPGSGDVNDEPTVQYAVESVESSFTLPEESDLLRRAAISLAMDQHDPFLQYNEVHEEGTTDVRDLFLLNHHLLSDSHLLAVSDHLVRLRGAAEAKSTGFRSALRQLDGVTNVSGKLTMIKNATGGGRGSTGAGIGGFLALPSAQEIEAAEREAAGSASFAHGSGNSHFPRPHDVANYQHSREGRPPPPSPPPPPPMPSHQGGPDGSRPRPLIGGMFLSGLSRLAAAATQPDHGQWEGGGTGLTPPSSPHDVHSTQPENPPTFYRREEHEYANSSYHVPKWDGKTGGTGLTPYSVHTAHKESQVNDPTFFGSPAPHIEASVNEAVSTRDHDIMGDANEKDGGWSEDGLDFDDEVNEDKNLDHKDSWDDSLEITEESNTDLPVNAHQHLPDKLEQIKTHNSAVIASRVDNNYIQVSKVSTKPPEVPLKAPQQPPPAAKLHSGTTSSFEEEFVIVLKEKIDEEEREMKESGRLRRWRPMSEDPLRRQRLMEVMVNQLDSCY